MTMRRQVRHFALAGLVAVVVTGCGGAVPVSQSKVQPGVSSAPRTSASATSTPLPTQTPSSTPAQTAQFLPQQCEIGAENTNANILFTGGSAIEFCQEAENGPGLPGDFGAPSDSGFSQYTWIAWTTPVMEATVCSGTTLGNTGYLVMDTGMQLVGESLCEGIPNG